ncbi:MAG: hypothetical protein JWQ88_3776 [Rhodoferax sp.]|nr:hypothetical protein [Rhodoferax sp.]
MEREDLELMLDSARRWFRANQPLESRVAAFKTGHHEAPGAWRQMADMGWTGLSLPEAAGGFAAGAPACFALLREAGRDARPEPLAMHLLLAPLLARAMPEHAEALASGRLRFAMADIATGPDAVRWAGAETLDGQAGCVVGGENATHLLLTVGQGARATLALLDLEAAGISAKAARLIDTRATLQIGFAQTPARRIDAEGLAHSAIDVAAAAQIADSAGVLDAAFALTLDYLLQRVQFGKPLSAQQAVQHKMAEIFCDLQQLLALAGRLAVEMDTTPNGPWPTLAPAKAFIGRRALRAAGQLIQVSGGIAVTEEYKLTHFYRRLHVAAALFGNAEAQLDRIDVRQQLLTA